MARTHMYDEHSTHRPPARALSTKASARPAGGRATTWVVSFLGMAEGASTVAVVAVEQVQSGRRSTEVGLRQLPVNAGVGRCGRNESIQGTLGYSLGGASRHRHKGTLYIARAGTPNMHPAFMPSTDRPCRCAVSARRG